MTTHWRDSASCRGISGDVFITPGDADDEPPWPTQRQLAHCGRCPVTAQCLDYALRYRVEFGTWGGVTAYQRRQLTRRQSRRHCPGCDSATVVGASRSQFCLACGVSWPALSAAA